MHTTIKSWDCGNFKEKIWDDWWRLPLTWGWSEKNERDRIRDYLGVGGRVKVKILKSVLEIKGSNLIIKS